MVDVSRISAGIPGSTSSLNSRFHTAVASQHGGSKQGSASGNAMWTSEFAGKKSADEKSAGTDERGQASTPGSAKLRSFYASKDPVAGYGVDYRSNNWFKLAAKDIEKFSSSRT